MVAFDLSKRAPISIYVTDAVLQKYLPFSAWADPGLIRLPGTAPAGPEGWCVFDEAYAGQMALRDRLIRDRRRDVIDALPSAAPALAELLEAGLQRLSLEGGFEVNEASVRRPDGVCVPIDRPDPLVTLGRLYQEDFCVHEKEPGDEQHRLTAAVLCFPAQWTLSEKIGRPLMRIHKPVASYDDAIGKRVQRLFDGLQIDRPIWRANAHLQDEPDLFTPLKEADPIEPKRTGTYMRSERQVLFRLPNTNATVFTIHTYMLRVSDLTAEQQNSLAASHLPGTIQR